MFKKLLLKNAELYESYPNLSPVAVGVAAGTLIGAFIFGFMVWN